LRLQHLPKETGKNLTLPTTSTNYRSTNCRHNA